MKINCLKSAFLLFISLSVLLSGCELAPFVPKPNGLDKINSNEKKFDIDKFEANLVEGLGNQWVGYSYVINQNGRMVHSGVFGSWKVGRSVAPADLNSSLYLASVGKTITAVSVIIAMREFGSGLNSMLNFPIGPYLPVQLNASPQVKSLRFRDLLTHRSGFAQNMNLSFANMKVLAGSNTVASNSPYVYSNVNFSLLKYAVFRLAGQNLNGILDETEQENKVNSFFMSYLKTRIFDPAGITSQSTVSDDVLYYLMGDGAGVAGWSFGDLRARLGSGGIYMNTMDLARFQAFLNNSETLLTTQERAAMYVNYLGWADVNPQTNPIVGSQGTYYSKQGSFQNNTGQGVRTIIMTYPKNKVEAVFMANTRGGNLDNTNGLNLVFRNAYDNAWD